MTLRQKLGCKLQLICIFSSNSTEYPRELNDEIVITAEEADKLMKQG
jgi:hypothetical protein